ncbi:MAG: hypothetical protein QOF61_2349, partial [Acidobacteriota bacterium]|nr:hypothetical protein [Acidobacteriota bacterium]
MIEAVTEATRAASDDEPTSRGVDLSAASAHAEIILNASAGTGECGRAG